ncbi:MAG: leucine-rich repeat domain-containing protein [Porcipelethomonas sp.]
MKKLKIIYAALGALTAFCSCPVVSAEQYCKTLDYIISGDTAVITGYEGEPETIEIPAEIDGKTVSEIRENAFYKCGSLKKVSVPETVKTIGHHAFFECTALENAQLDGNVYIIGEGCFSGCISLREVTLPEELRLIDKYGFYNCRSLEEIDLPEKLENIESYAFAGCSSLEAAELPEGIISIGDCAFYQCDDLKNINIPESVVSMGNCSVGFSGEEPKPVDDFLVSCSDSSIGRLYAQTNSLRLEETDIGTEDTKTRGMSFLPAAAAVISGIGLVILKLIKQNLSE